MYISWQKKNISMLMLQVFDSSNEFKCTRPKKIKHQSYLKDLVSNVMCKPYRMLSLRNFKHSPGTCPTGSFKLPTWNNYWHWSQHESESFWKFRLKASPLRLSVRRLIVKNCIWFLWVSYHLPRSRFLRHFRSTRPLLSQVHDLA